MQNFLRKLSDFMQGRYGTDSFNKFLLVVFFILWIITAFAFGFWSRLCLGLLCIGLAAWITFRTLSRNYVARSAENRKFLKYYNPFKAWFKLTRRKFKERKEYKYLRCPDCKSQLRVKNIKGEHTIRCPRCGKDFKKKI